MSATTPGKRGWPPAGRYGVVLAGCSGADTVYCRTEGAARRVRRVARAHVAAGGWSGWATLGALADLALARRGTKTTAILREFRAGAGKSQAGLGARAAAVRPGEGR